MRARGKQEVTKDDTEIVSALLLALADKVGQDRFEMWFGANARIQLAADAVQVSVPNQFYQDWLRANFRKQIEDVCLATLGQALPVNFAIDPEMLPGQGGKPRPQTAGLPSVEAPPHKACPLQLATDSGSVSAHGVPARRKFADLDSFVTGAGNRLAAMSAQEVVDQLGRISPLVIHGATGVGKTHLLEGIWTAARRRYPRLHAVYMSAEQFTSYFLEALHSSGVPSFRNKYRGVELFLIDDLQFFAGKRATLGELLHTIDTLSRAGRQLVFAADRAPAQLAGLSPELTARLSAGLVCRVEAPDYETRRGILCQQATRLGLDLPDEVLDYVATSFSQHARELSGALLKLHATSRALACPITLALAEDTLAESATAARRPVKLADVQQAVCDVLGLEPQSLCSNRRASAVAHPRMLAMWLARKHTRAALAEIGEFFGKRSHTTVISANKKIVQWLNDPQAARLADHTLTINEAVRKIEARLRAG